MSRNLGQPALYFLTVSPYCYAVTFTTLCSEIDHKLDLAHNVQIPQYLSSLHFYKEAVRLFPHGADWLGLLLDLQSVMSEVW